MKFKKGDIVKCVEADMYGLTKGKDYIVLEDSKPKNVYISDNNGQKNGLSPSRFELVKRVGGYRDYREGDIVRPSDDEVISYDELCDRRFVTDLGPEYTYRYIVISKNDGKRTEPMVYKYIIGKPEEEVKEFTMEEIAEKMGVSVGELKIKK